MLFTSYVFYWTNSLFIVIIIYFRCAEYAEGEDINNAFRVLRGVVIIQGLDQQQS